MATYTQLASGSWRVHIRRKGFPTISRTFPSRADAEAFALVEESNLIKRRADVPHSLLRSSVENVVNEYFKSPAFKNKALSTQQRERNASKPVLSYFANYDLSLIKPSDIQKYFDSRHDYVSYRGVEVSGDTLRLEKSFLSAVFNFGVLRDYCVMNPTKHLRFQYKPPKPREARLTVSFAQVAKKLGEFVENSPRLNPCFAWFVLALYLIGMRPGELSRIRLEYFDLEKHRIVFPRSSNKNKKERVFSFNSFVYEAVFKDAIRHAKLNKSPYVYYSVSPEGEIVPFAYSKPLRRFIDKLGLGSEFVPHSFRHERISQLYETGAYTDSEIALLIGDVNPLSLLRYRHLHADKLKDRVSHTMLDAMYSPLIDLIEDPEDRQATIDMLEEAKQRASQP